MHINSPVMLLSVPASRSSKTGRAVAISGSRTPSPARTSNASRSRGRSNARKRNARSPSSSNGCSIRCVEPAGNASPHRTNSLFCSSHASVAFQRSRALGGKFDFTAMPCPVRRLEVLEDDSGVWVTVGGVAPDIEVAPHVSGLRLLGPLEPWVLVRCVVEDHLRDDLEVLPLC